MGYQVWARAVSSTLRLTQQSSPATVARIQAAEIEWEIRLVLSFLLYFNLRSCFGHHTNSSCCQQLIHLRTSGCVTGLRKGEVRKLTTDRNGGDFGTTNKPKYRQLSREKGAVRITLSRQGGNNNRCMHTNYCWQWAIGCQIDPSRFHSLSRPVRREVISPGINHVNTCFPLHSCAYIRPAIPTKSTKPQSQKKNSPPLSSFSLHSSTSYNP